MHLFAIPLSLCELSTCKLNSTNPSLSSHVSSNGRAYSTTDSAECMQSATKACNARASGGHTCSRRHLRINGHFTSSGPQLLLLRPLLFVRSCCMFSQTVQIALPLLHYVTLSLWLQSEGVLRCVTCSASTEQARASLHTAGRALTKEVCHSAGSSLRIDPNIADSSAPPAGPAESGVLCNLFQRSDKQRTTCGFECHDVGIFMLGKADLASLQH